MLLSYGGLICAFRNSFLKQNNKSPSRLPRLARPFHLWLPGSRAESDRRGVMSWLENASCNPQQVSTLILTGILFCSLSLLSRLIRVVRPAHGKSQRSEIWLVMESVSYFTHFNWPPEQKPAKLFLRTEGRIQICQIPQLLGEKKLVFKDHHDLGLLH